MTTNEKLSRADDLVAQANKLREEAYQERQEEGRQRPLADRLCYAATSRCLCGAGMAYDPFKGPPTESVFKIGPDAWECSAVLLGKTDGSHTPPLPFAFYEIKSDDQPSAFGATTRPRRRDYPKEPT